MSNSFSPPSDSSIPLDSTQIQSSAASVFVHPSFVSSSSSSSHSPSPSSLLSHLSVSLDFPAPPLFDPHIQKKRRVTADSLTLIRDIELLNGSSNVSGPGSLAVSPTHSGLANPSHPLALSPTASPRHDFSGFAFAIPVHSPKVARQMQHRQQSQSQSQSQSLNSFNSPSPNSPASSRSSIAYLPHENYMISKSSTSMQSQQSTQLFPGAFNYSRPGSFTCSPPSPFNSIMQAAAGAGDPFSISTPTSGVNGGQISIPLGFPNNSTLLQQPFSAGGFNPTQSLTPKLSPLLQPHSSPHFSFSPHTRHASLLSPNFLSQYSSPSPRSTAAHTTSPISRSAFPISNSATLNPPTISLSVPAVSSQTDSNSATSPRDVTQISNYLLAVPLLAKLSAAELDVLAAALGERNYPPRSLIIKEGDIGDEFFIIRSGSAILTKDRAVLCTLKAGDYFGEQALKSGSTRAATISTGSDECSLFVLSRDHFQSLFGQNKFKVFFAKRTAVSSETMKIPNTIEEETANREVESVSSFGQSPSPLSYSKSREELSFLFQVVQSHVLFESMPESQQRSLVEFMYLKRVIKGQRIIQQGEPGNFWCVVKSGKFDVFKEDRKSRSSVVAISVEYDESMRIAVCSPGSSFGELALLYNSPRTASVIAVEDSDLWILDRHVFRRGLQNWGSAQYSEYEQFLLKVQSFHVLLDYERSKIAEALEFVRYSNGYEICRQGESGEIFFIVKSGFVAIVKDGIELSRLSAGQYFGERALLKKEERSATCIALGVVECLYLNRDSFIALLGPLEEIFKRKMEKDEKHNHWRINSISGQLPMFPISETETADSGNLDDPNAAEESPAPISSPAISKLRPNSVLPDHIALSELTPVGLLGRGSFGLVRLVRDSLGQTFALKSVFKQNIVKLGQQSHILNEKSTMTELNHPLLVRLIATHQDKDSLHFLFEPSLGGELFSILRARTYFDESTARFYAASIIIAFEYMHSKGIIYRDLKPENLLLDSSGYLKLTDFGFAKHIGNSRTWTLCGTPDYLAPEVVSGQGHSAGVDWWTLGILIFEMLASYPPFYDDEPMKIYSKILQGQIQWPMHFSPAAKDLISGLLCPKPTKRLGVILGGAQRIKYHNWFAGFDWVAFEARRIRAPIVCSVKNNEDLSNFESFTVDNTQIEYTGDPKNPDWDKDF